MSTTGVSRAVARGQAAYPTVEDEFRRTTLLEEEGGGTFIQIDQGAVAQEHRTKKGPIFFASGPRSSSSTPSRVCGAAIRRGQARA